MHAIKLITALFLFLPLAHGREETWGIYQFKQELSKPHFLFMEYVRRDNGTFFEKRFLDLFRFSYGGKIHDWTYLVGASYVDFETSSDERRIHQFLTNQYLIGTSMQLLVRLGLEERSFINDDTLYLRGRLRAQLNIPVTEHFGFATYNEGLAAFNGDKKYYQGFNENRFGLGLRFKTSHFELLMYQTFAELKTLKSTSHPQWFQLQTIYQF